ncbi:hypothetical protein BDM02DRAFT_3124627 [Thelephora ganbajun]|uniref:Uncharacterized protein n=1 Tax=Thelephora ganbajun TaxID=370292 RepID=A0ACB6YZR2_THEGA|nr:hypothetical protein BDM02DRAFT_3124627 [Thelephora ganbajun]
MSLLSLSPLLSSLFVSYANRAAALESASATPSPESEEWRALQSNIAALREGNEELKSENRELAVKLATAEASQEAFRSQVSSLKEVNTTQQGDIKSLQVELVEAKDAYDRLLMNSDAERAAHQIRISDHEVQRAELKEAVVEQQIKISKLERQVSSGFSDLPKAAATIEPVDVRELDNREGLNREVVAARSAKAKEYADREAREQTKREAKEKAEEMVRVKAERDAKRKAEKEAKEQAERKVKEKAEQEAREKAERQTRERVERKKERGGSLGLLLRTRHHYRTP